jgi:putative peptidoglycan lipid II flippase
LATSTDYPLQRRPRRQAHTVGIPSAIWVGSILLSRNMGLVREQIIGRTLGASREATFISPASHFRIS